MKALAYVKISQATYSPPVQPSIDTLAAMALATAENMTQAVSLIALIFSRQGVTLVDLTESVQHSAATLLREYVY